MLVFCVVMNHCKKDDGVDLQSDRSGQTNRSDRSDDGGDGVIFTASRRS